MENETFKLYLTSLIRIYIYKSDKAKSDDYFNYSFGIAIKSRLHVHIIA